MIHSRVGPWPYPQTLDKAGNACQGQTSSLLRKSVNYGRKTFIGMAPGGALASHANIRLELCWLPIIDTLAYYNVAFFAIESSVLQAGKTLLVTSVQDVSLLLSLLFSLLSWFVLLL